MLWKRHIFVALLSRRHQQNILTLNNSECGLRAFKVAQFYSPICFSFTISQHTLCYKTFFHQSSRLFHTDIYLVWPSYIALMWKWYFAEPCCAYTLQRASWLLPITDHNLDQLDEVRYIIVVIIMVNNITIIIKWSVWPSSIHHKNPSKCTLSKSDKACILSKPSNFYLAMVTIGMWFVGGRRLQRRVFIFFYQHITHRSLAEQL